MRKIALVGTASSGALAPFNDLSWEIWGVSQRASYVTRAARWFELHRLDGEPQDWANRWRASIKTFIGDTELVMMYPEVGLAKNLIAYPYQRIVNRFGTYFMTSSFSWMMALAIDEMRPLSGNNVEGEIAIFGVDMEYGTEYRQQRSGFHHFMHIANALGITIIKLAGGGLSYDPVPYPMWQDDPLLAKLALRSVGVKNKLRELDAGRHATQTMMAQCAAVLDIIEKSKTEPGFDWNKKLEENQKRLVALTHTSSETSRQIVNLEGQDSEQQWLSDYLQP